MATRLGTPPRHDEVKELVDRRDEAASTILTFVSVLAIVAVGFTVSFGIVNELPARSASSAQSVESGHAATSSLAQLTMSAGTPSDWCAQGLTPSKIGLATGNHTDVIDTCSLRALRASQNTPAGLVALRTALGLPAAGPSGSFHLRVAPQGVANASGGVAALAGMSALIVGHGAGTGESQASVNERSALATLGLNFTDSAIDTLGSLKPGDRASDNSFALTRFVAPRLSGFDFAQADGPNDGTYWKILNTSDYVEDVGAPGSSRATFGFPPAYPHVATTGYLAADGNWHVDAASMQDRDLRLIALVNLTLTSTSSPTLMFRYHFDPGPTLNRASIEACAWPCSRLLWTSLSSLASTDGSSAPSSYHDASVSLSGVPGYLGGLLYVSFTYHVGQGQPQSGPSTGFFFTHPRILTGGALVVPDWIDAPTNRSVDALIIGSDVDQTQLADPILDRALADYVNASGTLIALGSASAQSAWLADATAPSRVATASAPLTGGGDASHPLLTVPFRLHFADYDFAKTGYTSVAGWNSVLFAAAKDANGAPVPILQVTLPAPARNGTIILTSYRIGSTTTTVTERADFFANALLEGRLRSAFIDYGGTIPHVTTVTQRTRTMSLQLDGTTNEATNAIRVAVTLYVW